VYLRYGVQVEYLVVYSENSTPEYSGAVINEQQIWVSDDFMQDDDFTQLHIVSMSIPNSIEAKSTSTCFGLCHLREGGFYFNIST
jgi:hypothetical protein